ncbi:hypothetical protein NJH77_06825 [Serratia fonticola]|uniref:hypothetical protein n=1 Tax=Serratia fonticola TaxID=47917 RepID=UPI00209803A7|nr:hypothetical protein [Serratia fonticola]MCO7508965.1 hypothetical protein [Serratia fonticola]
MKPSVGAFSKCGSNPESRYDMAVRSDLDVIVLLDENNNGVGYCSFFMGVVSEPVNNEIISHYQIDYVFIREEFRSQKLSCLMVPFVAEELFSFFDELQKKHHDKKLSITDNSEYVSDGGKKFIEKVKNYIEIKCS